MTATDEHPFWVNSEGAWIDAEDLQEGDYLLTSDGVARVRGADEYTVSSRRVRPGASRMSGV
ncbi:MAG: hypothetical protein U5R31_16815 [Acidimicrobiia bacterium]|nr:hypothetical protein [Acidimicrobiia bacterium]